LIRLSGKKPGEDIEITYTGLRPGEKLYEELFHESEKLAGTSHPKILLANSRTMEMARLDAALDRLSAACESNDENRIYQILCELVPEHQSRGFPERMPGEPRESIVVPIRSPGSNPT